MADLFIGTLFSIVLLAFLIHAYIDPEESYMMGKRWMFEEEVELSEDFKSYIRFVSMAGIIIISLILIISYIRAFR
ncbi:hypothetical protein [Alkaliphilus crotonatoxidans]